MEMSGNCGYDEEFVEPPAEYLKCIVCCLVLRQPVQIATCGHRYCQPCFDRVKGYAEHHNMSFTCPVDRKEIDETKVFDDMGMARIVLDLKVKCSSHMYGCEWSGELRELNTHTNQCHYTRKQSSQDSVNDDNALVMTRLCSRLDKCEESLLDKEKELGHFKLLLQQLQGKVDQRDGELHLLKTTNVEMEGKIVFLEEANKGLKGDLANALDRFQNLEVNQKKIEQKILKTENDLKSQFKGMQSKTEKSINKIIEQSRGVQNASTEINKTAKSRKGDLDLDLDVKNNPQLYMDVRVLQENYFRMWSGNDLFDFHSVEPDIFKLPKKIKVKDAKKKIAASLGYNDTQCRLWTMIACTNGTIRPEYIDVMNSGAASDDSSQELFIANYRDPIMFVFLETCNPQCGRFLLPEFDHKNEVILFFKYYNPATETMTYCGHAYVSGKSEPAALVPMLCERAGLSEGTQLLFYEEVKVGLTKKICNNNKPFHVAVDDLMNGDIICFQVFQKDLMQFRLPTPIEYFNEKSVV